MIRIASALSRHRAPSDPVAAFVVWVAVAAVALVLAYGAWSRLGAM